MKKSRLKRADLPQRIKINGRSLGNPGFDPGVILRAHRFVAEIHGCRLERGHYMDREGDRADRWYAIPLDATEADAAGERAASSGYRNAGDAAQAAILRETGS